MSKIVLVTINLLAFLAYQLFFGGDVTVEQNIPQSIQAGETFLIEVNINKGDRNGFAKWQQSLPEGFIATAVETQGATFSFKNQDVKVIWMTIPDEESFTISYEIRTSPQMQGEFELSGKFSFIEENERRDIASEVATINVQSGEMLASKETPEEMEESSSEEKEETEMTAEENEMDDNTDNDESTDTTNELVNNDVALSDGEKVKNTEDKTLAKQEEAPENSEGDIVIERAIKHLTDAKYEVTLTIHKGEHESFAKIEDYLPPGFIASSMKNEDGMFSFNNNVMKVLWMTIPKKETLEVKYRLESTSDELDSVGIHGMFSFLDNDESKQLAVAESRFKNFFEAEEVLLAEETNEQAEETMEEETETSAPIDKEAMAMEVKEEVAETMNQEEVESPETDKATTSASKDDSPEETLVAEITNIPAPDTDVSYRVQIAASKKEVNQQYFIDRHGIRDNVTIEFHETWYKYTVGNYPVYKEARDRRNEVWAENNKINDAFVTAYNAGERISVQEALMITKQKWFK
jgi:hypothetical protein